MMSGTYNEYQQGKYVITGHDNGFKCWRVDGKLHREEVPLPYEAFFYNAKIYYH